MGSHNHDFKPLKDRDVHIWLINLKQASDHFQRFQRYLLPAELEKANRFHFENDRRRFQVCRGILKRILSWYLGVLPLDIRLTYTAFGKPILDNRVLTTALHFNLSHARNLALCAVTSNAAVGIDIEELRIIEDLESIARQVLRESELQMLLHLPAPRRLEAFFNAWTRKEAYIKALGYGLSYPIKDISVSLETAGTFTSVYIADDGAENDRSWSLVGFKPFVNHVAALAVETLDADVSLRQFMLPDML